MSSKPCLIIKIFEETKNENYSQLEIFDKLIEISQQKEIKINVPEDIFKGRKDKIIIKIILNHQKKKLNQSVFLIYIMEIII